MKYTTGVFIILSCFIMQNAQAEYYLEYPEQLLDNVVYIDLRKHPKPKHVYHAKKRVVAHHKKRSTCEINVYYIYSPPCGACNSNWVPPSTYSSSRHHYRHAFVKFSGKPTSLRGTYEPKPDPETFDMRTVDDDVMKDPNMNNQY
ncbi:MAG: hypothetical protein ACD_46C00291G0015 [uncultured bacterium]|nr:MAG: hypothetical protein ACD_46C00291G0015 [uncultured bacterium]